VSLQKLSALRVRLPDQIERRRHRRVRLEMGARFHASGEEAPCRTLDVSCGGALVEATHWPEIGDRVVLLARDLGRIDASVVRHVAEKGFGVRFEIGPHKRERIAEALTMKANPSIAETIAPERRLPRRTGGGAIVNVETDDGQRIACEILDFSLVGVALATKETRPPIGMWVKVGATHGRVARYFDRGFAVDFGPRTRPAVSPDLP
jgi:hypothetical protein